MAWWKFVKAAKMPRCLLSFLAKFGLRFSFEDYNGVKYFLLEHSYFLKSVFSHPSYHSKMNMSEFLYRLINCVANHKWFIQKVVERDNIQMFCTFEITSLVNVPGRYVRKYSTFNQLVAVSLKILFVKETSSFSRYRQMLQKYFPHIVKLRKRWNVRNDIANSPVWPSSMKTSNNLRALHGDLKLLLLAYTTNHQIKPFAHLFPRNFFLPIKQLFRT